MSADAIARALGADARVERRDRLAVLRVRDAAPFADAAFRARLLARAAGEGITHLALELEDDDRDAPSVPRG